MKRDIVIILSGGGMMGVFHAGVLQVIHQHLRDRVHSLYGASAGADVGVYFVSDQVDVPLKFFTEYLTKKDFIRKNIVSYLLKVLFFRNNPRVQIKDFINIDYVVDVAQHSDCKIDVDALHASPVEFFVKVIDIGSAEARYLETRTDLFPKLKAASNAGPFSSSGVEIEGRTYIDGDTLPTDADAQIVAKHADKIVICIQACTSFDRASKIVLYPLYLLAGGIIGILYGKAMRRAFVSTLFTDPMRAIASYPNVIIIRNEKHSGTFCTDKKKLQEVYQHGIEQARSMLGLRYTDSHTTR